MSEERLNLKMTQDEADNSLDVVLDRALRGYASIAPREGFEGRILARIDAEGDWNERRRWNGRWMIAGVSGAALVCAALMLGFVLMPGKKEIGMVGQTVTQQSLDLPEKRASIEHSAGIARERVRAKSATILQTSTHNFEAEQHRLMLQLMNNAPGAIATLAEMDREQASDDAFIQRTTPTEVKPIEFQTINNEPIEFNNTPTTQNNSSDAASQ